MEEINDTLGAPRRSGLGRRTLLKGAAWSVPAVVVVGATPAFAATGDVVAITSVTVNTQPTGAPNTSYINISNQNSTVTVVGTATPGVQIVVTATGGYTSDPVTATGGDWQVIIPAGSLAQGVLSFTATVTVGGFPDVTSPQTVTKDTDAPAPGISTPSYAQAPTKTLTVTGTLSTASSPTADAASGTLTGGPISPVTVTGSPWTHVFSDVNNNQSFTFVVTQLDGAGNSGSATLPLFTT